ncbi:MAG: hypothetical protein J1F28_01015 [Oscillospiraceae bacterium]|nr:hypothetical protein [Oscillospiraceae bacterium]
MNSAWTRAVLFIVSAFVILVAVGQIFFVGGSSVKTETALSYNFDEEIPFEAVFLRDEAVVYDNSTGILCYEYADGIKVGKSTVIARRYKNSSDIAYKREVEQLETQIEMLEDAEKLLGTDNSQLEAISAQINESHSSIIDSIAGGDFAGASQYRNNLLCAMCKREITLKESDGYDEKKASLRRRISELNARISGGLYDVYAGGAGYFVSSADGYEGEFGYSDIDLLTETMINGIVENPSKSTNPYIIGKLVSDYHWRAAAVIEKEKMFGIGSGSEVVVRIGSSSRLINVDVISIRDCSDGKAIYVFECDNLVSETMSSRTASFKLVLKSYGGLRVSRSALRENESGELGVYVKRDNTLLFKKVSVEYWGEDYVICRQETGDDYLKLYDSIVVEGKELYDGKIV